MPTRSGADSLEHLGEGFELKIWLELRVCKLQATTASLNRNFSIGKRRKRPTEVHSSEREIWPGSTSSPCYFDCRSRRNGLGDVPILARRRRHNDPHYYQHADADSCPHAHGHTDPDANSHTDKHPDTDAYPHTDRHPDADTYPHTDRHPDADTYPHTDRHLDADANSHTDKHPNADAYPHTDRHSDADTNSNPDPHSNKDSHPHGNRGDRHTNSHAAADTNADPDRDSAPFHTELRRPKRFDLPVRSQRKRSTGCHPKRRNQRSAKRRRRQDG